MVGTKSPSYADPTYLRKVSFTRYESRKLEVRRTREILNLFRNMESSNYRQVDISIYNSIIHMKECAFMSNT